ncbi:MAG TPA: M20/M25/M40 family metallo-hydrolase [Candidatus Dormibacteraeota bacterium]|nr:M20/M25/M40 family metallo-hydrolase [Candidatus Dormibacteraeota bacterium]
MNLRQVIAFAFALLLAMGGFHTMANSAGDPNDYAAADAQILKEIHEHSEAMENLEHLSDAIGARLTGSPQLKQANDWTAEMFRKYGLTNVHLEPWTIAHAWTRGTAHARIVKPAEHPLTIAAAGWSPGTPGPLRAPVVYFDAKKKTEFEKFRGKLKGTIVIYQEPASLSPPKPEDSKSEFVRPMQAPPPMKGEPPVPSPYAVAQEAAKVRTAFFKQEGVAAVLRDSNKPHALLNMTGIGGEKFEIGALPTAFVTGEGYRMLFRMLKHGPVEVELDMTNSFSEKPVEVYNTVAEIRGSEKPDEVVMLGAHLDSWDLATGSTDDGTGSMAVLEAARVLAKLPLKPKRTIRFALFSGEEEGLVGSLKYVETHKADLDKISGILVHDTGTGRVLTLGLHDNYQDREIVDQEIAPLRELKLLEPSMQRSFGTDHASFDGVGVPGFWAIQDGAEYSKTHHSQSDTFDKVWKEDLNQGAQVLAAWAYNTAQLPGMLPRRPVNPAKPEAEKLDAKKNEEANAKPMDADEANGASAKPDPLGEMDTKIMAQVKADEPELKANLQFLTDHIGPRLAGSEQLDQASRWMLARFQQLGLANAHQEPWSIANRWTRGPATGRVFLSAQTKPGEAAISLNLTMATGGWSPATESTVKGPVVGVAVEKVEDLQQYKGKLKGAIVVLNRPVELQAPQNPLLTPWGEETIPIAFPKSDKPFDFTAYLKLRAAELTFFAEEKAAAVLLGSEKWFGLLNMSISGQNYQPGVIPTAFIAREDFMLLWRLLDSGPVQAEVNIAGNFSGKPAEVYNTVAEIPGSEKPDEVVIIGAHLDSWDLATGATDNGTGSTAVLEAARALKKSGVKPKRTIRFVLFTGEEQGLNGSKAYVAKHQDELKKISAVLVHDSGTGKVLTIGLMENYDVRETIDRVMYPLARAKEIGLAEPTLRKEDGSDHVPFDEAGVPGFWCVQEIADYDKTHHSQADTVDRVHWDDLTEGAQVMAVFAYNVAQLPELLPRKSPKP